MVNHVKALDVLHIQRQATIEDHLWVTTCTGDMINIKVYNTYCQVTSYH